MCVNAYKYLVFKYFDKYFDNYLISMYVIMDKVKNGVSKLGLL